LVVSTGKAISDRADKVEQTVLIPHHVGERPAMLTTILGFDRYRATQHSLDLLTKMKAPERVQNVVKNLGDGWNTNDDVRRALLSGVCGGSRRCDEYMAWIAPVLRATRAN
jgi:hypothetical protein